MVKEAGLCRPQFLGWKELVKETLCLFKTGAPETYVQRGVIHLHLDV